jgi:hypothetical protein
MLPMANIVIQKGANIAEMKESTIKIEISNPHLSGTFPNHKLRIYSMLIITGTDNIDIKKTDILLDEKNNCISRTKSPAAYDLTN